MPKWPYVKSSITILLVFAVGMYTHLSQRCLLGPCAVLDGRTTTVTIPSCIFCFTVCIILADKESLWPEKLRKPHFLIMQAYEIAATIFLVDVAFKVIYDPFDAHLEWFSQAFGSLMIAINNKLRLNDTSIVVSTGQWLQTSRGITSLKLTASLLLLYGILLLIDFPDKVEKKYKRLVEIVSDRMVTLSKSRMLYPVISISSNSVQSTWSSSINLRARASQDSDISN